MSDHVAPARVAHKGKCALDEFLPEHLIGRQGPAVVTHLRMDPRDVQLEPIERLRTPSGRSSRQEQLWPMLAAALVALGVSVIALAVFASYGLF